MRFIKITLLLVACASMLSCGNRKKQVDNPAVEAPTTPATPVETTYVGVIAQDEACGLVIQINQEGKAFSVAPNNLSEMFHKPGMRVRFTTESRMNEKDKCGVHYRIVLKYITPLRG